MKKQKSIVKWGLGILTSVIIISIGVALFFLYQVNHVLGAHTEVVDSAQFETVSGPIAITNVNVLSTSADSMLQNQTVFIRGQEIEAIGDALSVPKEYYKVDGTGKYLIPGLVDSHIHLKNSKNDLLLYLANGITHIGEMTGVAEHFEWRKEIEEGALGPGIYIASPKMNSRKGIKHTLRSWAEKRHQNFPTEKEAREAVRKYKSLGYDAVKISSFLEPNIYFTITEEAKKQGIPAIGHVPVSITMEDFFRSEQSQLAHISEISKALEREFLETKPIYYKNIDEYLEFVNQRAETIAIKLKEKDVVLAATMWIYETIAQQDNDLPTFLKSIELEYMNPGWVEGSAISRGWLPGNNSYGNSDNNDPEGMRLSALFWNTKVKAEHILIRALAKHGVTMVTGTDANGADGVIPGFSLHSELESLSAIGLSNSQVLKDATVNAGEWMNVNIGKIEEGYRADLVLLNENPLDDIRNTKSIETVITKGKLLDRTQLDAILEAIKEANNRSRKVNIDEFIN